MNEGLRPPEKKGNNLKEQVLRGARRTLLATGLVLAPLVTFAQKDTSASQEISCKPKSYTTVDGNLRYYHNPHSSRGYDEKGLDDVGYTLGATKTPFTNLKDMKSKTRIPKSLGETDFFTNYINAKSQTKHIITDPTTGNQYYDFTEYDSTLNAVRYEGDFHWNIQRFLVEPHYQFFHVKKTEARMNVLFDMYKYFLYLENGNREMAWTKADEFMSEYVDPLINGIYAEWASKNYVKIGILHESDTEYYIGDFSLYSKNDKTDLPKKVLEYNSKVFSGEIKGKAYSEEEVEKVLTDYNMAYRKKDIETAKKISHASVADPVREYQEAEEYIRNKPATEYKIIKAPQYPPEYESWNEEDQHMWRNDPDNKDLQGKIQEEFTEEERAKILKDLKNYRFAE